MEKTIGQIREALKDLEELIRHERTEEKITRMEAIQKTLGARSVLKELIIFIDDQDVSKLIRAKK